MDRKLLKQNAKNSFKKKWFESAIVALIMGVFAGGTSNPFRSVAESSDPTYQYEGSSLGELFSMIPTEILHSVVAVMGATAVVFTIAGIFLAPIFTVGGNRYFLKLRKGVNTDIGEVTGNFKDGNYWNIVVISFVQSLKIALWFCLLFIPGIVKFYEYFLIEHILAVRPDINSKEAFQLSKKLMDGHKMDAFVLGLSFMGWNILSLFTFGILNIVYVNPYMYAMAKDFKDSVALVARLFFYVNEQKNNHIYDFSTKRFFYNYDFINYEGKPIFGRPGYEIAGSYNNWSGNVTMYGDFFKIDDYYIATFFKTNWHVYYTDVNNLDPAFPFKTAKYDISNYKTVEEIENNFPWVTKYLDDFTIGNNDAIYVSNMVVLPYTLSQFKTSSFLGDKLVAKAQSFSGMKDSCGLITINMVDSVVKENGEEKTIKIPQISYIVPPLYEEIIY